MAYRLSLWYKGQEIVQREDPTEDPVVAIYNCRIFQNEVFPVLKDIPYFKKVREGDIERRVSWFTEQLPLGEPVLNGKNHA